MPLICQDFVLRYAEVGLGLTRAPGIAGTPDVVSGMLAVSWADVERGVAVYEARKQAA
jgi:hypothetical protein